MQKAIDRDVKVEDWWKTTKNGYRKLSFTDSQKGSVQWSSDTMCLCIAIRRGGHIELELNKEVTSRKEWNQLQNTCLSEDKVNHYFTGRSLGFLDGGMGGRITSPVVAREYVMWEWSFVKMKTRTWKLQREWSLWNAESLKEGNMCLVVTSCWRWHLPFISGSTIWSLLFSIYYLLTSVGISNLPSSTRLLTVHQSLLTCICLSLPGSCPSPPLPPYNSHFPTTFSVQMKGL